MDSKLYEITVVGKQIEGSDKVTFINTTKENKVLQDKGLARQKYIHLQITEEVTAPTNGKEDTGGLVKPKTVVVFEKAHSAIFDKVANHLADPAKQTIWKADPSKVTLTELSLKGLWHKVPTGFDHELYTIENDTIKFLQSTSRDIVKGADGISRVVYNTKTATANFVEFFIHDGEMSGILAMEQSEIKRASKFMATGPATVTAAEEIEKTVDTTPAAAEKVAEVVVD